MLLRLLHAGNITAETWPEPAIRSPHLPAAARCPGIRNSFSIQRRNATFKNSVVSTTSAPLPSRRRTGPCLRGKRPYDERSGGRYPPGAGRSEKKVAVTGTVTAPLELMRVYAESQLLSHRQRKIVTPAGNERDFDAAFVGTEQRLQVCGGNLKA